MTHSYVYSPHTAMCMLYTRDSSQIIHHMPLTLSWKCRTLLRKCSPLLQNYRALCVSPTHRHVYAIHTWFLSNNTSYASTQMNMYTYISIYSEENKSIRFREKSICKRPLSPKISFLSRVLDLPFKTHGSFVRCVQLQRTRLAPCCTTHARSE